MVLVEGIDVSRITTNNVFEIWQTLGIEAARTALVKEVTNTLEEQGLEVDIRHIMLVADLMTSKGYLQQIGRHGIAGTKTSVLARAAFEITVPTIARAALEGQVEPLKGVTENVIVGATVPVGTGMIESIYECKGIDKYMNEKKLAKFLKEGVKNNKIKTGYKEVLQYIKGTKLIVLSKTLTPEKEEKIKKSAEESDISVIHYPGNSVLLGRLCSLSYGTSVVSLKNVSDEEIKESN